MGIKTAIFDISGTVLKSDGTPQHNMKQLLEFLVDNDVKLVFASNQSRERQRFVKTGLPYDLLLDPIALGGKKPSPAFIDHALSKLHGNHNYFETVYIGDNDRTDAFCAAHRKILYLNAYWSNQNAEYGIDIETPTSLIRFIGKFLLKDKYWGWEYSNEDDNGFKVRVKTMFDTHNSGLKPYAVPALKKNDSKYIQFFSNHFLASIYLSNAFRFTDTWSTYPPHSQGNSYNRTLAKMIKVATQESRRHYCDLFTRHTESKDSGKSRFYGTNVDFINQISTVHLNPAFKDRIKDKRILVIDDFVTKGYSAECARNLLYQAGAKAVLIVGCGKYGSAYIETTIEEIFDPYKPIDAEELTINTKSVTGIFDSSVDKQIVKSIKI